MRWTWHEERIPPADAVEAELQRLHAAVDVVRARRCACCACACTARSRKEVGEFLDLHALLLDDPGTAVQAWMS
jgi:phosphotransferase system enzyme I (PtsI)